MKDDLISRKEAIIAASNAVDEWDGGPNEHRYDMIASAINALLAAQQWIPVSERLPEHKNARYWVCTDTGHQCECRWTDNRFGICNLSGAWGWSIFDTPQYSNVVAWMPLPEPYKEDE